MLRNRNSTPTQVRGLGARQFCAHLALDSGLRWKVEPIPTRVPAEAGTFKGRAGCRYFEGSSFRRSAVKREIVALLTLIFSAGHLLAAPSVFAETRPPDAVAATTGADAEISFGMTETLRGSVVVQRDDRVFSAWQGMRLFRNDRVVTGPGGGVTILLPDRTVLSVGPRASFILDGSVFDPPECPPPQTIGGFLRFKPSSSTEGTVEGGVPSFVLPAGGKAVRVTVGSPCLFKLEPGSWE